MRVFFPSPFFIADNVMDDPVFITCACLLVGSPPALTLAQITSQNAKGSDGVFERLISQTICELFGLFLCSLS